MIRAAATCKPEREAAARVRGRGRHLVRVIGCAAALVVLAWASAALAQVETGRVESKTWRIRVSAPEDWRVSAQGSYPRVVVWMYRSNPAGKMLLTAERVRAGTSSVQYAQATVEQLERLRYAIEAAPQVHAATQASWIEFDDSKTFFRQAFLVLGDTAYTLTLSAPDRRARAQHLRAFDSALRSLERIEDEAVDEGGARPAQAEDADVACSPAASGQ